MSKGKFEKGCSRFGPNLLTFSVTGSKYVKILGIRFLILTAFSGDGLGRFSYFGPNLPSFILPGSFLYCDDVGSSLHSFLGFFGLPGPGF